MVNWETAKHMRHHLFVCIIYNWLKKYNKVRYIPVGCQEEKQEPWTTGRFWRLGDSWFLTWG